MDKKYIKKILIFTFVMLIINFAGLRNLNPLIADSGFDVDYDSSSSYDSGSDYSFSSSDDYDYGSSSSGSYSGSSDGFGFFTFIILILIILYVVKNTRGITKNITKYTSTTNTNLDDFSSEEFIRKVIPDYNEEEFEATAFTIYKDIQEAWMNFDLESVRDKLTDELYNMYSSQLDTLQIKNQKNIMKEFELMDFKVTNCSRKNDDVEMTVQMKVEFYDYIVDNTTGEVLRGSDKNKVCTTYSMTFIRKMTKQKVDVCPNCGAKIEKEGTTVCEYCNSTIVRESSNYVLSKKQNIGQR